MTERRFIALMATLAGIVVGFGVGALAISASIRTPEPTKTETAFIYVPGPTYVDPHCRWVAEELMTVLTDGSAQANLIDLDKRYGLCVNP